MSFLDEWVYLDYLYKLPEQFIVLPGEEIGVTALVQMSCAGEVPFGPMGTKCGEPLVPSLFPYNGITSADGYTPLFFWSIWIIAQPFIALGADPVFTWRLANICWLIAGLFVFQKLGQLWRINNLVIFSVGILVVASPYAYWAFSYVSTDAPSFFWGVLILYVYCRKSLGLKSPISLSVIGPIAVLFKITNIIALLAIFIIAIIQFFYSKLHAKNNENEGVVQTKVDQKKVLIEVAIALLLASIFETIWLYIHRLLDSSINTSLETASQSLTWFGLLGLLSLFTGLLTTTVEINGYPGLNSLPLPNHIIAPFSWTLIAGVLGAVFSTSSKTRRFQFAVGTLIAAMISAPILALAFFITTGSYFDFPSRYLAPILPFMLLSLLFVLKNKLIAITIIVISGIYLPLLIASSWIIGHREVFESIF